MKRDIGICGIIVFSYCLCLAIWGFRLAKTLLSEFFYVGIALMALCELPRYIVLAIENQYVSTIAYSCHILGGGFLFISLCSVCYMWSSILRLGPIPSAIYSKDGLTLAAFILIGVQISAICVCLRARSLAEFFRSNTYVIFVIEEIFQSFIYSLGLFMFGLKLTFRCPAHSQYMCIPSLLIYLSQISELCHHESQRYLTSCGRL